MLYCALHPAKLLLFSFFFTLYNRTCFSVFLFLFCCNSFMNFLQYPRLIYLLITALDPVFQKSTLSSNWIHIKTHNQLLFMSVLFLILTIFFQSQIFIFLTFFMTTVHAMVITTKFSHYPLPFKSKQYLKGHTR